MKIVNIILLNMNYINYNRDYKIIKKSPLAIRMYNLLNN